MPTAPALACPLARALAGALALVLATAATLAQPARAPEPAAPALPQADAIAADFRAWMDANNVPGLVWGVVADGQLVHVSPLGVADRATGEPVTADTRFRLASMTKALTVHAVLLLRDEAPDRHLLQSVAEVTGHLAWAPEIRIHDLVHHTAGFVTDDPWADRQEAMDASTFARLVGQPLLLSHAPGEAYEYSNLGYALLGSVIERWSGQSFPAAIDRLIFTPLGMEASGFDWKADRARPLAVGYRFEEGAFLIEPQLGPGAFSAIGGLVTNARDYARWLAYLLSGWPAEAAPGEPGAAIRAMRAGGGLLHGRARPGRNEGQCPPLVASYAGGLVTARDCTLGDVMFHSGGYPGYGSHMLLFPDAGVGIFAFANRTYAAPLAPVWDAAGRLRAAGFVRPRDRAVSPAVAAGYQAARRVWAAGRIEAAAPMLADNMLLDRSGPVWQRELARIRRQMGGCDTSAPPTPTGALSATFEWRCRAGVLRGQVLMAPLPEPRIQALRLTPS